MHTTILKTFCIFTLCDDINMVPFEISYYKEGFGRMAKTTAII